MKRNKRKRKIANLLLRNYLMQYFITTTILLVSVIIAVYGGVKYYKKANVTKYSAKNIMKDDYTKIDCFEILKIGGWIEVIDSNLEVVYRKGNPIQIKDEYTKEEYHDMLIDWQDYIGEYEGSKYEDYQYTLDYNKNKDFLLISAVPVFGENGYYDRYWNKIARLILFTIGFYFVGLIFGTLIFSRMSSKTFVNPLNKLLEGVQSLTDGNYSTRIYLKSENEFGQLRDAFNLMSEKIEEERTLKEKSEKARRRLVMDISHDLKNPLSSIIGYIDLLINNTDMQQQEKEKYLKIIRSNGIRANILIKNLFEFSKLESTDFKLNIRNIDICEFLRELIAQYIPKLEEEGFDYEFHIPEDAIYVSIDNQHLDRALSNLIVNSIKYNFSGTKIIISLVKAVDGIQIIISDNGIGIPKDIAENIFEPFNRVDTARNSKTGGTGLGLSISKTIIEKHGGNIELETDSGKGCKFSIFIKRDC